MPNPGETICGELHLERHASASLGAQVFQPVFIGRDVDRDERLWLSVVDEVFVPDAAAMSTFMAGANALVGVRHPALVRVVLVDREQDYCVVGYEELPGAEPLSEIIARGDSRRLLARAAIEVARGLAYLHRRELLHGALTPGTVVIWEGVPVLWEYGLAGLCQPAAFGPRARSLGGDVVAPEVPTGAPLTPAVDVYAWGAVMASLASGEFGAEAVAAILDGDVEPGRQGPLLDVIVSALRPEPGDRPRDGIHLLELLQRSLAAVDPAITPAGTEASTPADDGLQQLAKQYLEEMSRLEDRDVDSAPTPPVVPALDAESSGPSGGALGRVQLVKRSASGPVSAKSGPADSKPSKNRPWLAGGREQAPAEPASKPAPAGGSPLPQGEASAPLSLSTTPLPPPPQSAAFDAATASDAEPEWEGSYRLPSGTYAAVRDAPSPEGDGSVRGPEPGVSGTDAGVLGAAAVASRETPWKSRGAGPNAIGWLREAEPKAEDGGVGGLFDLERWLRELPHGLRKRWVLTGGGPPLEVSNSGIPRSRVRDAAGLTDEDLTPPEGIAVVDPVSRGVAAAVDESVPPSERETPPSVELIQDEVGSEHAEPEAEPQLEPGLPPMPSRKSSRKASAELPPMPEPAPSAPASEAPPAKAPAPFRAPRLPGPHGPPGTLMGVGMVVLAGAVAVAATLSASVTIGGLDRLWSSSSSTASSDDVADDEPSSSDAPAGAVAKGPCPEEMVPVVDEDKAGADGGFCIDRAEYPGIDRTPAVDVDLGHARKACEARGHALCTEAQWSRACRGSAGWRYPYGPRQEAERCRVGHATGVPFASGTDVQCVSPEGAFDLLGNVAEWTEEGAVMGGSIRSKGSASCATRQRLKPSNTRPVVGFRCCAPLTSSDEPAEDPG